MFPPRWHGTAFNISYTNEPTQKAALKAHVITSMDSFEVLSHDWKTSLVRFQPSDIEKVENRKGSVVLSMKPGTKLSTVTFTTRPEPSDNLAAALTQTLSNPKPEIRFLAMVSVIPTFQFPESRAWLDLHKAVMDDSSKILQQFTLAKGTAALNGPFVDVCTCAYRMRYDNIAARSIPANVKEVGLNIRRYFVVTWCAAVIKCAQPWDSPNGRVYYSKLATNASNTIAKVAGTLGINCDDLLLAVAGFTDAGIASEVPPAAQAVAAQAQREMDADLAKTPPCNHGQWLLMLNFALYTIAGIVVGMYQVDIDVLTEQLVEYTNAAIAKQQIDAKKRELFRVRDVYLKDLLELLDGQRYDVAFQYIFAIFQLPNPELGTLRID
jgi:hypothetical protein